MGLFLLVGGAFSAIASQGVKDASRLMDWLFDHGVNLIDTVICTRRSGRGESLVEALIGRSEDYSCGPLSSVMKIGEGPNDEGASRWHF